MTMRLVNGDLPDNEPELNGLMDFIFHEFHVGGKPVLFRDVPANLNLDPLELQVLRAHRTARTSLYQSELVDLEKHQVMLRDLLTPENPLVPVTDHGFSSSVFRLGKPILMFIRVIHVAPVYMSSGFAFQFQNQFQDTLIQSYRQRMKSVAGKDIEERKFVFFYQMFRQYGMKMAFQDVV